MTSADSVRRLEMQNFGLVFSCGVLSELDGVGTPSATPFFMVRARCLSAGPRYYSSTTSRSRPRTRRNRSAASCLCRVLRRAFCHCATRSPGTPAATPFTMGKGLKFGSRTFICTVAVLFNKSQLRYLFSVRLWVWALTFILFFHYIFPLSRIALMRCVAAFGRSWHPGMD